MDELNKKLSSLQEISKVQLGKILNSVPGPKDLTLDPDIIRPLQRICGVSWLKLNNVEKIFKLEPSTVRLDTTQFYLIYTDLKKFQSVIDLIRSQIDEENPRHNKYHVICLPKALYLFENILEELGLYHSVIKLYSLQWFPIQLDTNILTIEVPKMYKSLYIDKDITLLKIYSKSLWHLSQVFGKCDFVASVGPNAKVIADDYATFKSDDDKSFAGLVIFDRNIDYPSVLLTPSSYTALLNEVYQVNCGVCDGNNFTLDGEKDEIYGEIKFKHFTEVTSILSRKTKELRSEGESSKAMALNQIKHYVKTKLSAASSKKKSITNHLVAAEKIIAFLDGRFKGQIETERNIMLNRSKAASFYYLEQILQTESEKQRALTLFLLMITTQKLSASEVTSFLNKYHLECGFEIGFLYRNLINSNFIEEVMPKIILPLTSNNFYVAASKMKLIPGDATKIEIKSPTCCSYVFGGAYVPLVSQLAALLLSATPLNEIRNRFGEFSTGTDKGYPLATKTLVACVIGGVTYSEIAACALLEQLTGGRIILLSDRVISSTDITDALTTLS